MLWRLRVTGLKQDQTDEGGGEGEAQTEEGLLLRGFEHLTDVGQVESHKQVMQGIELVATVAEKNLFTALGNHTHRWLKHRVKWRRRPGGAEQGQPWERLFRPIFVHDARGPLHQFLAVGLQQHGLAFALLVDHDILSLLFSGFSILHLQDPQNHSIMCDNYSITLCETASIMTTRQRTCSCAGAAQAGLFVQEEIP
jgi:hypothetical protein